MAATTSDVTEVPMSRDEVVDSLGAIVFGGVAMTASALQHATDGQEVTFVQWRAILVIGEHEEGRRVGEVAAFVNAALSTTSRLLRRLERRGLLTLAQDEEDRRATRARLTDAGVRVRSSVLAYRRDEIAAVVEDVKPSAAADRVLRDLAARFRARGYGQVEPSRHPADPESTP
jgi:DNA-binding MarR family transcriptional regulator